MCNIAIGGFQSFSTPGHHQLVDFCEQSYLPGGGSRFFAEQKTADPTGGSYAPWLLIFNCLKESKSRIVAIVGLPIALPKLLLELLHSVPQSETLLVSLCA